MLDCESLKSNLRRGNDPMVNPGFRVSGPRYAAVIFRAPPNEAAPCAVVAPVSLHHFCQLSSRIR